MRHPTKMLEVYQRLKKAIDAGEYPVGAFLPREIVLAKNLGISRDTLRSVLAKLAEEKLIERMCPKGTMVCGRQNASKRPLTFLLPCADFLSDTCSFASAHVTRRMLSGFSQVAFMNDYRVETVPVSPTNNLHDIDWRKLDFVNAESLLVAHGEWYRDLFPLLLERGCRVVFIHGHIEHMTEDQAFLDSCFRLKLDAAGAMEAMVSYLYERGCQRIALLHRCISEPGHPMLEGYRSGLKKCGLKFSAWDELPDEPQRIEIVKNKVQEFYIKSGGFDSLIIAPDIVFELRVHNLYSALGLNENIRIIVSGDLANIQLMSPSLTSIDFSHEEIGRIAAQTLLSADFLPGEELIAGSLIERESTSNSNQHFTIDTKLQPKKGKKKIINLESECILT
jgi:DNA-binding LacI/PurR family transcriptional regulator